MTYHELLKIIVVENKIISYEYFMDNMQQYEIQSLVDMIPWAKRQSLETTRLLLWGSIAPYLKKNKTAQQLMPLVTDNANIEEPIDEIKVDNIREQIQKIWNNK